MDIVNTINKLLGLMLRTVEVFPEQHTTHLSSLDQKGNNLKFVLSRKSTIKLIFSSLTNVSSSGLILA
jgi:hypothetical protein